MRTKLSAIFPRRLPTARRIQKDVLRDKIDKRKLLTNKKRGAKQQEFVVARKVRIKLPDGTLSEEKEVAKNFKSFCVLTDGTKWSKNRLVQSNSFWKEGDVVDAHKLQQSSAKSFGLPNKQERV